MAVTSLAGAASKPLLRNIFDVAQHCEQLKPVDSALARVFSITAKHAACQVGRELSAKYGLEQDNRQLVVAVTNR
jgi:hypothetical protein